MSRYIEENHLIDNFYSQADDDGYICCPVDELEKMIKAEPTADVRENVHGEWLVDSLGAELCSVCGTHPYSDGEYYISGWESDFCPHCGADMRKGENNG